MPSRQGWTSVWRDDLAPIPRNVILNVILASPMIPRRLRGRALRLVGHAIHPSATVSSGCFLGNRTGLTLGSRVFVNHECFLDLGAPITIGPDTALGYRTMLVTCSHELGDHGMRAGAATAAPIVVGRGVWIGAQVTVLPGVTIGDGAVIAAGSVVTGNCRPDTLYAGVPAVARKRIDDPGPR